MGVCNCFCCLDDYAIQNLALVQFANIPVLWALAIGSASPANGQSGRPLSCKKCVHSLAQRCDGHWHSLRGVLVEASSFTDQAASTRTAS